MSDKLQFIWNIFTKTNKGYFVNNAFGGGIWHFYCICHDFYIKLFELNTCNLPYVHSLHYSFYFLTFLSVGQMHSDVYIFPGLCVMLTLYTYSIYILDESSKTMAN